MAEEEEVVEPVPVGKDEAEQAKRVQAAGNDDKIVDTQKSKDVCILIFIPCIQAVSMLKDEAALAASQKAQRYG